MSRRIIISVGLLVILVAAVAAVRAWMRLPGRIPPQPIAFNHKLHLENVQGLSCVDCHQFVTSQTYAGLPSKYICFDCHDPYSDEDDPSAQKFAVLRALKDTEGDIPWHRVTGTSPDVFFSHRRHVTVAKLDCRRCHPDMPDRTTPPTRGPIVMSMDTCLDCHEQNQASTDCVSCHR